MLNIEIKKTKTKKRQFGSLAGSWSKDQMNNWLKNDWESALIFILYHQKQPVNKSGKTYDDLSALINYIDTIPARTT